MRGLSPPEHASLGVTIVPNLQINHDWENSEC